MLISPVFWAQTTAPDSTQTDDVVAPGEVVEYDAQDIYFAVDSGLAYLTGEAQVVSGTMTLRAHRIVLDLEAGEVCAYGTRDSTGAWVGRPEFKDGPQSFSQDQLCYNFETGKGLSRHAVTTEQDIIFHADRAKRQPDETVHVRDGKFTTCDADNPHFHFHLTKAIMVPNEKVVSGPLYLKFRKIPTPLALPFGWFPLQREKQSQGILLPGYGDGGDLGFFLKDLGYYMPLGDHWDAKLLTDIYTGGSWAARVTSNYNYRYRSTGSFSVSYQRQREGFAGTPGFGLSNNFFVRWSHSQDPRARPNSRFNASVNFGSSGNFQQNLNSTQEEYLSNTFQSSLQWTAKVPRTPFSTNISARHNQNSLTGNVTLTVPSLSLNMQRTSLSKLVGLDAGKSALLDGVAVTYSTQMENTIQGADSAFGAQEWSSLKIRNGLKHKLKLTSSSSVGFVSLSPSFTYDQYDSFQSLDVSEVQVTEDSTAFVNDTLRGFQSANEWRLGVTASTRFYGTFNMPGEGRVKAVRHVLAPSLGVSYNPERMREQSLVTDAGEVGWNPYALGRYVPNDLREAGSLNFGLSQNIEAKVADRETGELKKVKILDNLSTSGNFNFVADSLKLSDFQTRAFTSLFNRVNVNVNATHTAYARDTLTGQVIDTFLASQGQGLVRLKRVTGAMGTSFKSAQDAGTPWNARLDYNVNLSRQWASELQRDTSVVTHALSARGSVNVLKRYKLDVTTGYDLARREFTPTNLNFYVDLHCWELSFNWIPFGVRQSFSLRLNVKSALLRDLKLEARGSDGKLLF
ncbi:MAG: putative LPS assembly protein LptD [Flavobacteriales bacterium]